jgi:hypothetical protein
LGNPDELAPQGQAKEEGPVGGELAGEVPAQPADATAMLLSGAFDDLPEVADDEPSVIEALRHYFHKDRA